MRAHIIENGVIVNTVITEELQEGMIEATEGVIGDSFVNGLLVKADPPEERPSPITVDQVKKNLSGIGLTDEQIEKLLKVEK